MNKSVIINLSLQQFIVDSLTIENVGTMGLSAEKELAEILQNCWDASYQTLQAQTADHCHCTAPSTSDQHLQTLQGTYNILHNNKAEGRGKVK